MKGINNAVMNLPSTRRAYSLLYDMQANQFAYATIQAHAGTVPFDASTIAF